MTYHFVNLVSWKFFSKNATESQKINVDSISLQFICFLFGRRVRRISGVHYFNNSIESLEVFYLTSSSYKISAHFVLPFWRKIEEIELTDDLILAISKKNNLVVGISSPKQDKLAELICQKFPEKTIYCLGAAIYTNNKAKLYDRYGLSWFFLMLQDWRRFVSKISLTISSATKILFLQSERRAFRKFLQNLSE